MKAPDKIYINVHPLGVDYSIVPIPDFGCVEYIRKDALLEWTKKEMKEWPSESNTAQGVKMGLTLVLDKIESL